MKTVCKKLLCLMLVAMMLVSAVPFAFADGDALYVDVHVVEDGVGKGIAGQLKVDGPVALTEALAKAMVNMTNREFLGWANDSDDDVTGGSLTNDSWLSDSLNDGYYLVVKVAATSCKHTNKKTTNTATCTDAGTETVVCVDCGETISTKDVAALGHDFNGATCKCGATRDPKGSITFHYMTSALNWAEKTVYVYENAEEVTPPAEADDIRGFKFLGWSSVRNGAVDVLEGNSICWNNN